MKLRYFRPTRHADQALVTNFGDELNRILWPRIFPDLFDEDESVAFFAIGSLLGYPKAEADQLRHMIVFGTGAAIPDAGQREPMDDRWAVYCVRGPLTVQAYSLDPSLAATDPAILVHEFAPEPPETKGPVAYMPHITEAQHWGPVLQGACRRAGITYLDPCDPPDELIRQTQGAEAVIAEAMHGAIVADALRVPWIPVYSTFRPHRFKWTDWCRSLEMEFEPRRVPNLAYYLSRAHVRAAGPLQAVSEMWLKSLLASCASRGRRYLSTDAVHRSRIDQLLELADRFRSDVAAGRFR